MAPSLAAALSAEALCPENSHAVRNGDSFFLGRISSIVWLVTLIAVMASIQGLAEVPSAERLIKISTERHGDQTLFFVENLQAADVTVTFETKTANLESSVSLPCTKTYPGQQRTKAFTLTPKDAEKGWSWEYTYYATYGSTTAVHDGSFVYALPYAPGKAFRVSQGFNGDYSHSGPNQFAIDWKMPVGTPVHAARGGVVVGLKNDSDLGGGDSKYDGDANFIMIRHADGTIGHYVHLAKAGALVKLGQEVKTGEQIALSGNTGHSTGPHLHFAVFKARDGKQRQTLPIRFQTSRAVVASLEQGKSYTAAENGRASSRANRGAASLATIQPSVSGNENAQAVGASR